MTRTIILRKPLSTRVFQQVFEDVIEEVGLHGDPDVHLHRRCPMLHRPGAPDCEGWEDCEGHVGNDLEVQRDDEEIDDV